MSKVIVWLHGEIKTPPFSTSVRIQAGFLLRELQAGVMLSMPESRPMPSIGKRCYELRVSGADNRKIWRVIYRIDVDAIVIFEVFAKKTQTTPNKIIEVCKKRLKDYDKVCG